MPRAKRKPRSTAAHLKAILAQRAEWHEADRMLAENLADIRAALDDARAEAKGAPLTVLSAAGTPKPNPVHAAVDRLARQESSLTRRLGLGLKRNARGRYEVQKSPAETRVKLWEEHGENVRTDLIPGLWCWLVKENECEIAADSPFITTNPQTLPV